MTPLITLSFSYQKQHRKSEHSLRHYWGLFRNSKGDTFEITRVFFLSRDIWVTRPTQASRFLLTISVWLISAPCPSRTLTMATCPCAAARCRQVHPRLSVRCSRDPERLSSSPTTAVCPLWAARCRGLEPWNTWRSVPRSNVTFYTAAVLLISCLNVCFCIRLNTRRIQQQANHVLMTGLSSQVQRSVTWLNTHTHKQTKYHKSSIDDS